MGVPQNDGSKRISRRKLLKRSLIGGVAAFTLDSLLIEPSILTIDHIKVSINGLPPGLKGFKIAQLSDFHCGNWMDPQFVREAGRRAMAEKPDLIVVTGDFVHGYGLSGHTPDLRVAIGDLRAPHGVFGVLGNHDGHKGAENVRRRIREADSLELLENRHAVVERGGDAFALVGLDDMWVGLPDERKAFRGLPEDMPRILLEHNPDLAEEMPPGYRVDLQISGHTHGGQIRFPWGWAPHIPSSYGNKFREGLVHGQMHRVYVNRGLGGLFPMHPRLFCPPQVSLIELV